MEMRLRAPVTRGYFCLLGALRLVNAALPRNIDQKKISSGTQCPSMQAFQLNLITRSIIPTSYFEVTEWISPDL